MKLTRKIIEFLSRKARIKASINITAYALSLYGKNEVNIPSNDLSRGPFVVAASREDGVGIQALTRICAIQFAAALGRSYLHVPFHKIEHQDYDPHGSTMSSIDWAMEWESLLNLGRGYPLLSASLPRRPIQSTLKLLEKNSYYYGDSGDTTSILAYQKAIKRLSSESLTKQYHFMDLGLCRLATQLNLYLTPSLVQTLQDNFAPITHTSTPPSSKNERKTLAIHIRRGDAWNMFLGGSQDMKYINKVVSETYYVSLIRHIFGSHISNMNQLPSIHIYSNGTAHDFPSFQFNENGVAHLASPEHDSVIPVHFHLCESALETLCSLASADILIPGKSSFGVLAAILNPNKVLLLPHIGEFYQYRWLDYMATLDLRFQTAYSPT